MKNNLITYQIELMEDIRAKANINIVNCGNCGSVMLHESNATELTCPYCDYNGDICDFPDFIYNGIDNQ
jgi:uncharacterized CHY-type Zn-finger protein